nr:uncharacterized protein LOC112211741 [Halyomorpha halys]
MGEKTEIIGLGKKSLDQRQSLRNGPLQCRSAVQPSLCCTKTLIRPIVTYGGETWTLCNDSINQLDRFERVIQRRIIGPVCENGNWRKRKNGELFGFYKECGFSSFIRIQRLKWLGHVMRISEKKVAHKLYINVPDGVCRRGRPKGRWRDGVEQDLKQLRIPVALTEDSEKEGWWLLSSPRTASSASCANKGIRRNR